MNSQREQAIVIGGSMAGLLAARVLSDHFQQVTIIERDQLPDEGVYRNGVPQSRHLHTLLVQGQRIMETMFPGFSDEMAAEGAPEVTWGIGNVFLTTGGYAQPQDSGIKSNLLARVELEWLVRKRIYQIENIRFITERDVRGLIATADGKAVIGVETESRTDHRVEQIFAQLVVDASGRGSKAPEWLQTLGYDAPPETVINAHTGYATRWYEIPADASNDWAIVIQPRPGEKLYRGGGLLVMDGNRWVVTLLGANGDYPPTDEEGFMAFAKSLPGPDIYEAIKDAKPITSIYGYRKLENRMRHYERLTRRPEGFVVTGDAACALNPIYGQGMTASAMEAEMMGKLLRRYNGRSLAGFPAAFQKDLRRVADGPWLMATSEDMRYPDVEGQRPNAVMHLMHRYLDLLAKAIPYDKKVTMAFVKGMNLLEHPSVMMHPAIVARVLLRTWQMRRNRQSGNQQYQQSLPHQAGNVSGL
ncbi:MAG: FAD-dependent monooxygenase [Anaerolineae bacterium]|nr:FAD-dependent monooxygenase [Anaerolineae bacterium]